jgi:FkbM family methyltransferase
VTAPPITIRVARAIIPHLPVARYRVARAVARLHAAPFLTRMPARVGGLAFRCDLRDVIARDVCLTGVYEPQETLLVRAILRPGMTFVDVGAHWGYFTLIAAACVGPGGTVVSLEPDPRSFARLRGNLDDNRLGMVRALPVAAADVEATVTLWAAEEGAENSGLSRVVTDARAGATTIRVSARTLDQIAREFHVRHVDLMKMDVEGGEAAAIAGMPALLAARAVSRLLLELHPAALAESGRSVEEIYDALARAGYRGLVIDHSPATTRRLAYGRPGGVEPLLRPLDPARALDAWPHQLWLAPGVTPPC